jgi:homoserine kinase type II
MAVKTQFTDDEFVNILSEYDLGAYAYSEAIQSGAVQTNFIIYTTRSKYVFRYYENRSRESVLFERDLLGFLRAHQYPCPAMYKNRQGAAVGMHGNKPYAIFEFLAGEHIENPGHQHKQQLIQKAAELQKLTVGYRSDYTPHRWNYHPDLCRTLAQTEASKLNTKDAHEKFAWLAEELAGLDLPHSLPKGVCHCDFHFSNVLFQGDQFVALLDFDDANYTFLSFDLVSMIDAWAWPHHADQFDPIEAGSIVQEYTKQRPLDPIEQQHLFDVYKLSVLFDCVWFFGRGAANDFREKQKINALNSLGRGRFADLLRFFTT